MDIELMLIAGASIIYALYSMYLTVRWYRVAMKYREIALNWKQVAKFPERGEWMFSEWVRKNHFDVYLEAQKHVILPMDFWVVG